MMSAAALGPTTAHAITPTFTFHGGGWGHGIGLSQYGARGYALKGWKHDAIIRHYYQGTKLVSKPTAKVRVDLDDAKSSRTRWRIKAGSTTALTVTQTSNSAVRITLDATKAYWITTSNGNTQVRADDSGEPGSVLKSFTGNCFASAGGLVQVLDRSGPFDHSGVRWRGTIHFKTATTTTSRAINYVNIEEYLYGVVPRESPSSWPTEALRAQAIAARSYVYQDAVDSNVIYCTTRSQVYNGHSRRSGGTEYRHEATSTNAAVDATSGKVVWYGSETAPVKTYFSSSTGGHTANIEHVWGGTAKPYYTGVVDADQDSPYYTWSAGAYSASFLADRIRALDTARGGGLEYSAPAPAVVTAISTERAASGHVRYANVKWSTGATYRITGTTLQSALGLRSSKYSVTSTYPTINKTRYQESDGHLSLDGRWQQGTNSSLSGNKMLYSSTAGSSVTAEFTGNGFAWIGKRSPYHGIAAIYIDGKYVKTVDQYSGRTRYGQTIFSTSSLEPGSHRLVIRVAGKHRARAKGARVAVDALDVINGGLRQAAPTTRSYEQDHSRIAKMGTWGVHKDARYSGGSESRSNSADSALYATFYGTEVRWIGTAASSFGRARVSVDGGATQDIVLTSTTSQYRKVLYTKTGLSRSRAHVIKIQPIGQTSGGSNGDVSVDALKVTGGWLVPTSLPATLIDDRDGRVHRTGAWSTSRNSKYHGGSHQTSQSSAAAAKIRFEGTGITWIDRKAPSYGKMRIYLDGAYKGTVNQYSDSRLYRRTLWSSGVIGCGVHVLELKPTGTHSRASTGSAVGIDAFRVSGRILTP